MLRKLLSFVGIVTLSLTCFSQTLTKLEGEDAVTLFDLSRNGRYALGVLENTGIYMYDLAAKKMTFMEGSYYINDASDNGIYAGNQTIIRTVEGKGVQTPVPAYFKDGVCTQLPLPADANYTDGTARAINADGSVLAGYVSLSGEVDRRPCIWTLQSDKTYALQLLPTLEKDLSGRKPQGVDALHCSDTGDVIIGRIIDCSGFFSYLLTWTKNGEQSWELKELGKDILFEEGTVFPTIPDADAIKPDAVNYFTNSDLIAYMKDVADYEAGKISNDPENSKQNYITDPDSIAKYNEAAKKYNDLLAVANEKLQELVELWTEKEINVTSVSMSGNGRYVGTTCEWTEGGGGDPMPLSTETRSGGSFCSPLCFDLQTGTYVVKDFVQDGNINKVADNGDIFIATPHLEYTRTAFVIPAGTEDLIDVAEWVRLKTDGKIDMKPDFTFNVMGKDSLIVGDVIPSANGRVLLGTFYAPAGPGIVTYYVDFDGIMTNIENTAADAVMSVYPNPVADVLYIKGNVENVSILDLSGRKVYESSSVSGSVPVGMLGDGTYFVKMTADGKTTVHKVLVKK